LRAGVEKLRHEQSWNVLASETMTLIDTLAPARGWRASGPAERRR